MTTNARIGKGTIVRIHNAAVSPPVLTQFGEITSISPPSEVTDTIDATHMQSPGRFREFIYGMSDGGDFSFEANYVPGNADEDSIIAARTEQQTVQCEIEYVNGTTWRFDGIVTGFEPDVPVDDKMTVAITLKVTGAINVGVAT